LRVELPTPLPDHLADLSPVGALVVEFFQQLGEAEHAVQRRLEIMGHGVGEGIQFGVHLGQRLVLLAQPTLMLEQVDVGLHPGQQILRLDGLGDVVGAPHGKPPELVVDATEGGHEDHRDVPQRGVGLEALADLVAVDTRQQYIQQDQLRGGALAEGQHLLPRGGGERGVTPPRQKGGDGLQVVLGIVHHQHGAGALGGEANDGIGCGGKRRLARGVIHRPRRARRQRGGIEPPWHAGTSRLPVATLGDIRIHKISPACPLPGHFAHTALPGDVRTYPCPRIAGNVCVNYCL